MIKEVGKEALRVFDRANGIKGVIKLEPSIGCDNAENVSVRIVIAARILRKAINSNDARGQLDELDIKQGCECIHIHIRHNVLVKQHNQVT